MGDTEGNDPSISGRALGYPASGSSNRELSAEDLSKHMLTLAYALGIVIFSVAVSLLVVALPVLCLFYPDKANAFLVLLASPVALLALSNAYRLGKVLKEAAEAKLTAGEAKKMMQDHQAGCPPAQR